MPGRAKCEDGIVVSGAPLVPESDILVAALRAAGARFAFVHGSRAAGKDRPGSDIDIAAWFAGSDPAPWSVRGLPPTVDLVVLDRASLELAGRVALHGVLIFDDDPPARVAWQADTRLQYLDEQSRTEWARRAFFDGVRLKARADGRR